MFENLTTYSFCPLQVKEAGTCMSLEYVTSHHGGARHRMTHAAFMERLMHSPTPYPIASYPVGIPSNPSRPSFWTRSDTRASFHSPTTFPYVWVSNKSYDTQGMPTGQDVTVSVVYTVFVPSGHCEGNCVIVTMRCACDALDAATLLSVPLKLVENDVLVETVALESGLGLVARVVCEVWIVFVQVVGE